MAKKLNQNVIYGKPPEPENAWIICAYLLSLLPITIRRWLQPSMAAYSFASTLSLHSFSFTLAVFLINLHDLQHFSNYQCTEKKHLLGSVFQSCEIILKMRVFNVPPISFFFSIISNNSWYQVERSFLCYFSVFKCTDILSKIYQSTFLRWKHATFVSEVIFSKQPELNDVSHKNYLKIWERVAETVLVGSWFWW